MWKLPAVLVEKRSIRALPEVITVPTKGGLQDGYALPPQRELLITVPPKGGLQGGLQKLLLFL